MARINLLPWREERRRQLTQEFTRQTVLAALFAVVVGGYGWYHVNGLIDQQERRNDYLEQEIKVLQSEIKEIEKLESTRQQLLARMNVIQRLQQRRPQIVHLFFEIADTLPDGVYLEKVTQKGDKLQVAGKAESNARVSSYMRKLDASPWLTDPQLEVIESGDDDRAINDFTLRFAQTAPDSKGKGSDDGSS